MPATAARDTHAGRMSRLRAWLPQGRTLPSEERQRRHSWILAMLWAHVPLLTVGGIAFGAPVRHAVLEGALVGVFAAAASLPWGVGDQRSMRIRGSMAALGLIIASSVLIQLSGGHIEAHFHFFVVIIVLSLYEDWLPFLLAFGYVVLHHGVIGTIDPEAVYNHADAFAHPWRWAAIHGAFISAAAAAAIVAWRLNELARVRAADADARAWERSQHVEELQRRAGATRRIIDSAHECYVQIDEHSTVMEWNAEAEVEFGYTRAEAIGSSLTDLIIPPEYREAHRKGIAHFLATGDGPVLGTRLELPARHKDGREFPIEITISALPAEDGSWRFHAFFHDISERRRMEERDRRSHELERRQRQAFEINDSVVQRLVVANLAFELGRGEQAAEAVHDALDAAKRIISDWGGDNLTDLQREGPALPRDRRHDDV